MVKRVVLLASLFTVLAYPAVSYSTPILYSIGGTATDFSGSFPRETANVSGYMVISDEIQGDPALFGIDYSLYYSIPSYLIQVEGVAGDIGSGRITLNPEWFVEFGLNSATGNPGIWLSAGSPYPFISDNFKLPPLMTLHSAYGSEFFDQYLDLTLTAVPEPSRLLLVGTGLIGTVGIRRWRRSRTANR